MSNAPASPLGGFVRSLLATAFEATLLAWGLGGFPVLLHTPRALALLAIWFATSLMLTVNRPVRGQEVARADKDPRAMLALALLPLAAPGIAAWGGREGWLPLPAPGLLGWLGVALSAAGLALRVAAMQQLGARFSPLVALQQQHTLETTGWYAHVRHPGYLGALMACLGTTIAFGSAVAIPLALAMAWFQTARIRREEALLAGHFGAEWQAYVARTGALFPRFGGGSGSARP